MVQRIDFAAVLKCSIINDEFICLVGIGMRWKRLPLILVVVAFVVVAGVVGYFWYNNSLQPDLVEISKQSPVVRSYLEQHPNATYTVGKWYLTSDGMIYTVDYNWKSVELKGSAGEEPVDGRNHYCWAVHWNDPTSMIEHIVDVYVDKDVLKIVLITEAW